MIVDVERLAEDAHVLGAWTLGSLTFAVFHGLAFLQAFVAGIHDRGGVKKDFTLIALNETKPLVRQLFDRPLRHFDRLLARS